MILIQLNNELFHIPSKIINSKTILISINLIFYYSGYDLKTMNLLDYKKLSKLFI